MNTIELNRRSPSSEYVSQKLLNRYISIEDTNNYTIFHAINQIISELELSKEHLKVDTMINILSHILFANYPLTVAVSKERLASIIMKYSRDLGEEERDLSINKDGIKRRKAKVDLANFDLAF